jgi:CRP-like cAMP-binding protein
MPGSLVRKLEQFVSLSETEKQVLNAAPARVRQIGAHQDIVSDGDRPRDVSLITEGFACRYKLLGNGRRQILSFLIPGDICDLRAFLLRRMDHGIAALNQCEIAVIPHQRLFDIIEKHPRLALALLANTMVDAAIYRRWLTDVGRLCAHARIAHLLCEIWTRLHAVGLTQDGSYEVPMTQADIADAMGLSNVHVNRTLKRLRSEGLISWRSNLVRVLDWERLQAVAEFDPSYLACKGALTAGSLA